MRASFEANFGVPFDDVRIHADKQAGQRVRAKGASALAAGPHLWFAPGRFAPHTSRGAALLRHELAHVVQQRALGTAFVAHQDEGEPPQGEDVDLDLPEAPSADAELKATLVLDALQGITTGPSQAAIVEALTSGEGAATRGIYVVLFRRAPEFGLDGDGLLAWIRDDVTDEDWLNIRTYAFEQNAMPESPRLAAREIVREMGWLTWGESAPRIEAIIRCFSGGRLDAVLLALENERQADLYATADWLFGQTWSSPLTGVDRVTAQRLADYLEESSERGLHYTASYHASAVFALLSGVTGTADSAAIRRHFERLDTAGVVLVMQRLRDLSEGITPEAWLKEDLTAADYEALRGLEGLTLEERPEPGWVETKLEDADLAARRLQIGACISVGVVTGALSVVWDFARAVWDISVATRHVVGLVTYLVTRGALGRESVQAFEQFFAGLTALYGDLGMPFNAWWEQVQAEYETIEGPGSDCQRAEYATRHVVNAVVNLALVVAGGYGLARGGVAALRGGATAVGMVRAGAGAELATEALGAGVRTTEAAVTRIGGGVAALRGLTLTSAGRAVATTLRNAGDVIAQIRLAAQNYEVWAALRRGIAAEREFWESQRAFWTTGGWRLQTEHDALLARLGAVAAAEATANAAEVAEVVDSVAPSATALESSATRLLREVTGEGWTPITTWDAGAARAAPFHALPAGELPQLGEGYAWTRFNDQWWPARSPDTPDVPLALYYWPEDPEGTWSAVIVRPSDGARISSASLLRDQPYKDFPEARRGQDYFRFDEPDGPTWDKGHMADQAHSVRSTESRVAPTGIPTTDRLYYTSEHLLNFTPEPVWWNQDARNQLFGLMDRARRGGTSRSMLAPQRGAWADAHRYRMLQEFSPDSVTILATPTQTARVPLNSVVIADAEWLVIENQAGEVLDAFRVPFNFAAPNLRASDIGQTWESLLRQFRRPLTEVPGLLLLSEETVAVEASGWGWILVDMGLVSPARAASDIIGTDVPEP